METRVSFKQSFHLNAQAVRTHMSLCKRQSYHFLKCGPDTNQSNNWICNRTHFSSSNMTWRLKLNLLAISWTSLCVSDGSNVGLCWM